MQRLLWKGGRSAAGCLHSSDRRREPRVVEGEKGPATQLSPPLMRYERAASSYGVRARVRTRTTPSSLIRAIFQLPRNMGHHLSDFKPHRRRHLHLLLNVQGTNTWMVAGVQRGLQAWACAAWRPCHTSRATYPAQRFLTASAAHGNSLPSLIHPAERRNE